ncbi:DUF2812 domain-containing protein [Lysinibacillus sp. NPDC048646]|uniref:DUF2812 domain-containing protein n=1 Tax=Lysinibacillus sp. NPDC048646 TaxID=3390574 RepID=UPI003CFD3875
MKWLWSYQIDKTEEWLTNMASKGYHLCNFNAVTRMFTFEAGEPKAVAYAIRLDKSILPSALVQAGWQIVASSNRWQFAKNEIKTEATVYPSRETIVKRARMHTYLFILLAIFFTMGQLNMFLMTAIISGVVGSINWWLIAIPLSISTLCISLSIYVYRAYRRFEKQEMDMAVPQISSGRKVRKIKLGWMDLPLQTKRWLEEQAQQGLELERVTATIFTFRETTSKRIAYEVSFEPKVDSSFFTIHKELGWQLKFASNITWLHYSIWAMPYDVGEIVPALTYDAKEKIRSMKKSFFMSMGIGGYILIVSGFTLYTNLFAISSPFFEWSIAGGIRLLLILMTLLWVNLLFKSIVGFMKEMKMIKTGL